MASADQKDPVETLREDMVEKVSVAGWKEAFAEKITWIRYSYRICLLILSGFALNLSFQTVKSWCASGYKDDVSLADVESLPFSNVTICAQLYFNLTFIRENLTIPPGFLDHYQKETNQSVHDFYESIALFLPAMTNPRIFSAIQLAHFRKVIRANPQLNDFSAFSKAAALSCEHMLRKCWFGGHEFDCCQNAVQSFDNMGICYLIPVNLDYDNALPSARTFNQVTPAPRGGLTLEVSVPVNDFPWLEEDAQNGYMVFVNPVPYGAVQEPLTAPHGAATFIKVTPSKRVLSTECAAPGHLSMKEAYVDLAYDPEGWACVVQAVVMKGLYWTNCLPVVYDMRPNSSLACSPVIMYAIARIFSAQDTENAFGSVAAERIGTSTSRIQATEKLMEESFHAVFSNKGRCRPHCQYWTYSSTASFFDLENTTTYTERTMYSKISIFYSDFSFRQYNQVKESTIYLAVCDFGNVVGLYWGMSMVSFFHVFYYVPRYLFVRVARRQRRTKVEVIALQPISDAN